MATKGIVFQNRTIKIPGAYGFGDASEMLEINSTALNIVLLIGSSLGGQPNEPLFFSKAGQDRALRVLRGGPLWQAAKMAWNPGAGEAGADIIGVLRVDPAEQASLQFVDTEGSPANAFKAKSRDWGAHGNDTQVGTLAGITDPNLRRVVVKKASDGIDMTSPELGDVMAIAYTGNGTATLTIDSPGGHPTLTVNVAGQTDSSASFSCRLDVRGTKTLGTLARFIQAQVGFNVKLLGFPKLKAAQLDPVSAVSLTSAARTVRAINGACVDWLNRYCPVAVGEYQGNTATVAIAPLAFMTGGVDGTPQEADWIAGIAKLESEPGYFFVPCTDEDSIHKLISDNVTKTSDVTIRKRRQAFFGHGIGDVQFNPDGSVDTDNLEARIFALNNGRTLFATPCVRVDLDGEKEDVNGVDLDVLYPSWLLAAAYAGIKAGRKPQESLTFKYVGVSGVEGALDKDAQDKMIDIAASPLVKIDRKGFRIVIGQLAQVRTSIALESEPSVLHVSDTIVTRLEQTLEDKYTGVPPGKDINIRLNQIKHDVENELRKDAQAGMLVGGIDRTGKTVGPFRNVRVTFEDKTYGVEFEGSIAEPGNYITILARWSAVQGAV